MDKYEYTIKSDKIRKLVDRRDYETAVKIADTIDWERIRNVKMLTCVSQAYEKVGRIDDAKDILLMAYECAPVGRRFLYKLTELAVRQKHFDEAEDYLREFTALSPQDPSRLILRYEIAQAKGAPADRLITILEAYQKREFEERWSYELAYLYYQAGKNEECVKLCDEIVLWFGVGSYVDKAMELKQRIAPLTPEQIEKRENKEKYLRRLEEIEKEFDAAEGAAAGPSEQAAAMEPETAAEAENLESEAEDSSSVGRATADQQTNSAALLSDEADSAAMQLGQAVRSAMAGNAGAAAAAAAEKARAQAVEDALRAEMESSLAREIEMTAMKATIDEAVLQETTNTMETVGAVHNDHSDERERTKIADGHFMSHTKTKTFVREARAINEAIEKAQGSLVDAVAVEEELRRQEAEEAEAARLAEEKRQAEEAEAARLAEEKRQAEEAEAARLAEEKRQAEEAEAARLAEEKRQAEEAEAARLAEEKRQAEEAEAARLAEETAVADLAAQEDAEEQEETAAEQPVEQSSARDHYVLIVADSEESGLRRCVSYIKRMRELMGRPATQVAKISGVKLASKDIEQTLKKLRGRDLIVVGIRDLPDEVLAETVRLMSQDKVESFIALIDTEDEIDKLQRRIAFFAGCRVLADEDGSDQTAQPEKTQPEAVEEELQPEAVVQTAQSETVAAEPIPVPADGTAVHKTLADLVEEALRLGGLEALQKDESVHKKEPEVTETENPSGEPTAAGPEVSYEKPVAVESEVSYEEPVAVESEVSDEKLTAAESEISYEEPTAEPESHCEKTPASDMATEREMTPKEFYGFAVDYARMLDAEVDDLGGLAIFAEAERYQQERIALNEELAQEMVEKAILRAEKRSFKNLFSNRYNKEGYLILKEEHFKE